MNRSDGEFVARVLFTAYANAKQDSQRKDIQDAVKRIEDTIGDVFAWIEYPWNQDALPPVRLAREVTADQVTVWFLLAESRLLHDLHTGRISEQEYQRDRDELACQLKTKYDAISSEFDVD
jgi:hypothetical protein